MRDVRILVVDDDPLLRAILRTELSGAGFEVATAGDGTEALRHLATTSTDLVILDLVMPVLDGRNARRLIRAGRVTSQVPVLLLSAHASESDRAAFLAEGFADIVQKPYELDDLLRRIRRIVSEPATADER